MLVLFALVQALSTERPGNGENPTVLAAHSAQLEVGLDMKAMDLKFRMAALPRTEIQALVGSESHGVRVKVNFFGIGVTPGWHRSSTGRSGVTKSLTVTAALYSFGLTVVRGQNRLGAVSWTRTIVGPLSAMIEGTRVQGDSVEYRLGTAFVFQPLSFFQLDAGVDLGRSGNKTYIGMSRRF